MNEFGCFLCGKGKSPKLTAKCQYCKRPYDVSKALLKLSFGPYKPEKLLGRGFYGVVLLARNNIGRPVALKICSSALYTERNKSFKEEVNTYLAVGDHPNVAELLDGGTETVQLLSQPLKVFYLATKFLPEAETLEDFIAKGRFTVEDMIGIALQVCSAISRVEGKGLWHNDLHGRNILLARREEDEFDHHPTSTRYLVKVVDFGSAIFSRPGPEKEWQDIQWIGKHLDGMLHKLLKSGDQLPKAENWFLRQLPELIAETSDPSPGRRIKHASDLAQQLELLWQKSARHGEWQPIKLSSAFGYTNANGFPDDSYVGILFSDKFPWLRRIREGESAILLTGPRGCGKTMIMRSLRLRTIIARREEQENPKARLKRLAQSKTMGFFVSARLTIGLYRSLGETPKWLATPALSNCFFNLAFVREIVDTLLFAAEDGVPLLTGSEVGQFSSAAQSLLKAFGDATEEGTLRTFSPLDRLGRKVEQIIERLVNGKLNVDSVPATFSGPKAIIELWSFLSKRVKAFKGKRLVFLLDDFTQPMIPEVSQRAYLPIMFRSSEYQFIVSAHSRSVALTDLSGVRFDPSREFAEINLGREFYKASDDARICEAFLDDIFSRRFATADVLRGVRLRKLLGSSRYEGGNVAEEIASRHRRKALRGLHFHGLDTLVHICTGDVGSIIDLVGNLVGKQVLGKARYPITAGDQNKTIRLFARREIRKLLDIREYKGRHLYDVAICFGRMSREKIIQYALSDATSKGKGSRAPQYLRIELQEHSKMPDQDEEVLRALLQHGVFIDGGLGASNVGTPTQVFIFRRLFAPVFPTTTASRDSFSWTTSTLSRFLRDPLGIMHEERRRPAGTLGPLFDKVVNEEDYEDLERV